MVNQDPICQTCDGTGTVYSNRSWFTCDGYSRSRCPICEGTGHSKFLPPPDYQMFQRKARAALSNAGGGDVG